METKLIGIIELIIRSKYNLWLYRIVCLYDRYIKKVYNFPQADLCVYKGFWDKLGKTTRNPYFYKIYSKMYWNGK